MERGRTAHIGGITLYAVKAWAAGHGIVWNAVEQVWQDLDDPAKSGKPSSSGYLYRNKTGRFMKSIGRVQ